MKTVHAIVISTMLVAGTAAAEEAGGNLGQACKSDVAAYCKDVPTGEGRILRCLREHKDMLSDGCKTALRGLFERRQDTQKAK